MRFISTAFLSYLCCSSHIFAAGFSLHTQLGQRWAKTINDDGSVQSMSGRDSCFLLFYAPKQLAGFSLGLGYSVQELGVQQFALHPSRARSQEFLAAALFEFSDRIFLKYRPLLYSKLDLSLPETDDYTTTLRGFHLSAGIQQHLVPISAVTLELGYSRLQLEEWDRQKNHPLIAWSAQVGFTIGEASNTRIEPNT